MFRKKTAVAVVTVLLVCVAAYLNWSYQKGQTDTGGADKTNASQTSKTDILGDTSLVSESVSSESVETALVNYFAAAKLSRQKARDEALTILENTTASTTATKEAIDSAVKQSETIAFNTIKENNIEGIVMSKGYKNCLAYISDSGLTVIISPPDGGLTALDTAKIMDIAIAETSLAAGKIKIVEASPK